MSTQKVVTRFAPSPTGLFHAGSYRTALFSWIFARQNNGKFVLRIEDTDKARSKKEFEDNIIDSLKWLGLNYDEFYRQSERTEIYKKYLKQLLDSGHAFVSEESEGESKTVIRFKNPNKKVIFDDLIRGKIEFDTTELGDFVIAKNENEPIFHLVNVIDDFEMGITHIIRGEDHISNTPRQILIFEAIGAPIPKYAHIPLLLGKDRSKLSKRNGAISISSYRDQGFLKEAVVNYLSLLGWNPGDDREILSVEEILRDFKLERVQKAGAIFDDVKLLWFNREYMHRLSLIDFTKEALKFLPTGVGEEILKSALPVVRDKISCFKDLPQLFSSSEGLAFIKNSPKSSPDLAQLLLSDGKYEAEKTKTHLKAVKEILENLDEASFVDSMKIKDALWSYASENGKGDVLWPFRVSLTGAPKSPDPFTSASVLGKKETILRIENAFQTLQTIS